MSNVWIAVLAASVAAVATIVGPVVVVIANGRQRTREKLQDWARQDEVAARLLNANKVVDQKLDVIHGLVNSQLTGAMRNELSASEQTTVLMEEVIRLNKERGIAPSDISLTTLHALRVKIQELRANMHDRLNTEDKL